ncbi:hypothetical protein GGD89_003442 [Roseospira visakhapatnamensis]|uniref:Uncharacterized protein n=1 Tax=Roseospira visakhapatnamensis TaxID=390880 RepID=A0A7W6RGB2_9PROT|nr:hypothetical protein [Roseospira visakhapatnamensis]
MNAARLIATGALVPAPRRRPGFLKALLNTLWRAFR